MKPEFQKGYKKPVPKTYTQTEIDLMVANSKALIDKSKLLMTEKAKEPEEPAISPRDSLRLALERKYGKKQQ
jgi:hypothetical protein